MVETSLGKNTRNNFSNQRSRFAPNDEKEHKSKPLVKDFYVNSNGDVYITTKNPFSPKPTSTTPLPSSTPRKNPFKPILKAKAETSTINSKIIRPPFVSKLVADSFEKNLNLKSTTTEANAVKESYKEDLQEVGVPKPVTVPPDQLFTVSVEGAQDSGEIDDDEYYLSSGENTTSANYEYVDEDDDDYAIPKGSTTVKTGLDFNENKTEITTEKVMTEEVVTTEKIDTTTMDMVELTVLPEVLKTDNITEDPIEEEYEEYYEYEDSGNNNK